MSRFYVCCAWHDFPQGGTYATTVSAKNYAEALHLCHLEMAESISVDYGLEDDECRTAATQAYDDYYPRWYEIDCYRVEDTEAGQMLKAIIDAADAPHYGDLDVQLDNIHEALEKARSYLYG